MRVINPHHQKKAGESCQEFLRSWVHNSHWGKGPTHHASKVKCPRAKTRIDSQARRAFAPLGTRSVPIAQYHHCSFVCGQQDENRKKNKIQQPFFTKKGVGGGFLFFFVCCCCCSFAKRCNQSDLPPRPLLERVLARKLPLPLASIFTMTFQPLRLILIHLRFMHSNASR